MTTTVAMMMTTTKKRRRSFARVHSSTAIPALVAVLLLLLLLQLVIPGATASSSTSSVTVNPDGSTSTSGGRDDDDDDDEKCVNEYGDTKCKEFAMRGECHVNPTWMFSNCRKSCGECIAAPTEPCKDLNPKCPQWGASIECLANPGYMMHACPMSCWQCYDYDAPGALPFSSQQRQQPPSELVPTTAPTAMESRLELEQRKQRYSQTEFGMWQMIPLAKDAASASGADVPHADAKQLEEDVRDGIRDMERYSRELPMELLGAKRVCNNRDHDCMNWIMQSGGSCYEAKGSEEGLLDRKNLNYFLQHCSLACRACDQIDLYRRCHRTPNPKEQYELSEQKQLQLIPSFYTHLTARQDTEVLVGSKAGEPYQDEWVVAMSSLNPIIDSITLKGILGLMQVEDQIIPWENATEVMASRITPFRSGSNKKGGNSGGGATPIVASGQVLDCRKRHTTCSNLFPRTSRIRRKISQALDLHTSDMVSAFEFVRYRRDASQADIVNLPRYSPHLDYSVHDEWHHGGPKLLTMFVCLQAPEKGGGTGFPELDWTLASPAEHPVLIWPNMAIVKDETSRKTIAVTSKRLDRMKSEQLPIVEGELIGMYVWIHLHPHNVNHECA